VKLLLDEHVPVAIAALLRARGHDAEAVGERMDLRGMTDGQLWMTALAEDRTVVTYDIGGFLALATEELSAGRAHPGVVLCNARTHPPTRNGVGLIADALEALESGHGSGGLGNSVLWLPESRG
jgi:predicted nuclease of predicted toxin-antitoxin system